MKMNENEQKHYILLTLLKDTLVVTLVTLLLRLINCRFIVYYLCDNNNDCMDY